MQIYIPAIGKDNIKCFEVQAFAYESDERSIIVTGLVDKVILEGVEIAVALLKLKSKKIISFFDSHTINIHFTDYSFIKEGSSAFLAIYLCLYEMICLLKPLPIRILVTGEIDLKGNIISIGGINQKKKFFDENQFDFFVSPRSDEDSAGFSSLLELEELLKQKQEMLK